MLLTNGPLGSFNEEFATDEGFFLEEELQ